MRWLAPLILISTALTPTAAAAELTLDEAVQTALDNSPVARAASERSLAAAARSREAQARRWFSLDLSEIYSYSNNPSEVFAMKLNQGRFSFDEFVMTDPNDPEPLTTWITRLELTVPIYTGGHLGARVDQADHMATAEELRAARALDTVAFDTIAAYTNLAKAREQVQLITTARATTAEHVALAEAYARQGLILSAEVLKAKVFLAQMDELLAQSNNGARLAEAALNFEMGVDQALPRRLAPLPPPPVISGELDDWTGAALEQRRDLRAARRELEAGRLEEKAAKPWYLPEIAATAKYDLYDDSIFGSNGHSGSVMAFARLSLFQGGADAARREAARHQTASGAADVQRFEGGIKLEVQQAWHDLETARARLATAQGSLESASEALRVTEHRFRQGLEKMIDLLDAETALREAQLRELVARYDVSLGTYRLLYVSGSSLTRSMEESS
jgi:outer membrane protein TolC